MNGVEHSICQCQSRRMPVKAHWFDVRPRMTVSSDSNTLIQRGKRRVASDVSINLGFNSYPPTPRFWWVEKSYLVGNLPLLGFNVPWIFGSKYDNIKDCARWFGVKFYPTNQTKTTVVAEKLLLSRNKLHWLVTLIAWRQKCQSENYGKRRFAAFCRMGQQAWGLWWIQSSTPDVQNGSRKNVWESSWREVIHHREKRTEAKSAS